MAEIVQKGPAGQGLVRRSVEVCARQTDPDLKDGPRPYFECARSDQGHRRMEKSERVGPPGPRFRLRTFKGTAGDDQPQEINKDNKIA